ncbi:MAG: hypothetical protein EXR69_11980, partial [Myxococcales bacterium]|nr:hypothetical protein [Myxococcales bacterium]
MAYRLQARTVSAAPKPGGSSAFTRAEFDVEPGVAGSRLSGARFYGPSGTLARSAAYVYDGASLVRVDVTPRGGATTSVTIGALSCASAAWDVTPQAMLSSALS